MSQRRKMTRSQMSKLVLDAMEMFDQQITPARCIAKKSTHFYQRLGVDLTAFRFTAISPQSFANCQLSPFNSRNP